MSGFEVVGLILALYPVVADAVAYYRGVRSGDIIHDLVEEVRAERVIFSHSIQHLCLSQVSGTDVVGVVDPQSEIFALWQQSSFLNKLLASHAAEATTAILETLKSIHSELQQVHRELDRINPNAVDFRTRLRTSLFTLRSGQEASAMKTSLKKIHKLNKRLRRLVSSRPQHKQVPGPGAEATLCSSSCAGFATGVFRAVESHYRCSCQRNHPTKLQVPQLPLRSQDAGKGQKPMLQLLFSADDDMLEKRSTGTRGSESTSQSTLSGETSVSSLRSQGTDLEHSQADYSLSSVQSNNSLTSSMTLVYNPKCYCLAVTECGKDRNDEIRDICASIRALGQVSDPPSKQQTLGVLQTDSVNYELKSPRPIGDGDARAVLSLDDLFTGDRSKLARRHRISLALSLAWGVTTLHQTPWIGPSWTWSDFSAIMDRQRGQFDEGLFITKYFPSQQNLNIPETPCAEAPPSLLKIALGEPVVARLGYALIELAKGERFASLHEPSASTSTDKDLQDLLTARHLLETGVVRDEECEAYSAVVQVCLYQQIQREEGLGMKTLRSQDAWFERDLTRAIVQPLYNIYTREWGSPSPAVSAY
ncbi:hypothetical protein G647_06824 [Cladophialophora carrionii CBS 160.54]|uniref:DUF7580 domain-containing protein n=1 Tax=Cladophialophora carrionii CBS 160.54 TaxID=1279043 RepID=V9D8V6_9EURO|nr:uncharacterized protein G647_06824 [Cladophialophora carrionii CBS 160.54]ETI22748.1 hypothetical protein G647_06824 [Cladophialophora carrionii CBS 160.54]